ncbi:hypothetical protein LJ737_05195 [Hymenobacter sp. 15J16-1T3B]|uniref:hypothetical protein n=1 Tax=Hymenobacter sp. 15J16-1T3B TaxID=2886941 RepID=UPI001D1080C2|nr:hypothetical protein [Hymenobacter sp. 15J16-1T3B]MCC3156622.1 hypothetical protein [Hymenobacter sp. 15J16-1T3B]
MTRCLRFLLVLCALLLGNRTVQASHALSGQLTYDYAGTSTQRNRYRVHCAILTECGGSLPTSLSVSCRVGTPSTTCASNDPRNFSATLVRGPIMAGTPYCASLGNACGTGGRFNYEWATYEAYVELPPAASWTLSVSENARPTLANVTGTSQDLYLEATLNNQIALASGILLTITNTSPQYLNQDVPVTLACLQQRSGLSFATFEPDGDSLVYSLERPLEGCNQPMTYKPFSSGMMGAISTNPPCVATLPAGASTSYSATFPLPSFMLTGSCPVRVAQPSFAFDTRTGNVSLTPYSYDATSPANNRYLVAGKVTEYRRINSRYYLVGSMRRDLLVVVQDCGSNQTPNTPGTTAGTPGPATDSLVLDSPVQVHTAVDYHFSDPNPGDLLTVTLVHQWNIYGDLYDLPSPFFMPLTVVGNGTATPVLQVRLHPSTVLLGRTVRVPVWVADNACPFKINRLFTLVIRVGAATPTATRPAQARAVLPAYPNPFSEQVTFTVPRPRGASLVLVRDPLGRVVAQLPVPAGAGAEATLTWVPGPGLPAGLYTARAADGGPAVRLLRR